MTCLLALSLVACGGGSELGPAKYASADASSFQDSGEAAPEAEPAEPAGVPVAVAEEADGAAERSSIFRAGAVAQAPPRTEPNRAADVPAPDPSTPVPAATPPGPGAREPLLIYTATMTLAVFGTREALAAVEALARALGGYLVRRSDDSVTVRVPTKAFHGALDGIGKLGDELHREVKVEDVTERFADLEIRLKNAEAVRLRLEGLLAKAAKVEDALAVERELERVTQTIEQLKGKLRLLEELVRFSTVTVMFRARPQDQVGSDVRLPFEWLGGLGLPQLMNLEAP